MGLKFRKSIKVAPGVKLNLNTNSTSVTIGTKGAHYTVNSNGKKTTSASIPGTGLSYVSTTGGSKKQGTKTNKKATSKTASTTKTNSSAGSSKKKGCGSYLLWILIICLALIASALLWIPGIIAIVVFAIKKGENKKRNLLISIGITLVSFFIFGGYMSSSSTKLTDIKVEWNDSEYDISDTAEVKISPVPSTAKIETLTLSENSIASLKYKDGKAIVSFKATGSDDLYFTANKNINSDTNSITVINKEAERIAQEQAEQEEAERIAAEQAEADRIAAEQAEADRIAQEQAQQAEAERIAQEQAQAAQAAAQTQNSANNFNTYDNASQQQTTSNYVLNTSTMKFHFPRCRDVKKIAPQNYSTYDGTRDDVINQGYSPCGHCNP